MRKLDTFVFDLAAGQVLTARIDQQGVDVEAVLFDPQAREVGYADSLFETSGTEVLYAVAGRSGRYRLELRLATPRRVGSYVLTLERPRHATAKDRRRCAAQAWHRLGILEAGRGRFQEALVLFRRAALHLDIEARELSAGARYRAGRIESRLGHLAAARTEYEAGLSNSGAVERAFFLRYLAQVESDLGNVQGALDLWLRCSSQALRNGNRLLAAVALNERGVLFRSASKLSLAVEELHRAVDLWPAGTKPEERAKVLANLGHLHQAMGHNRAATLYLEEALEAADRLVLPDLALDALGALILRAPSVEKAEEWADRAGTYRASPGARALFRLRRGAWLLDRGRLEEARRELERAAAVAGRRENEGILWNARANLAHLLDREGHEAQALAEFEPVLHYYLTRADLDGIYSIRFARAQALEDLGRRAEARREVDGAVALAESVRLESGGRATRGSYLATLKDIYGLAITLRLADEEDGEAFELNEQAHARALLEDLAGRRLRDLPVPRELAEERDDLKRRIAAAHHGMDLAGLGAPATEGEPRLDRLLADLLRIQARIELLADPRGHTLVGKRPLTLEEVQRQLDENTLLLVYNLGKDKVLGWAVGADRIAGKVLRSRADLESTAGEAYEELRRPPGKGAPPLSPKLADSLAALSRILLRPFAEEIRGKRLVVLADGILAHFPFGVLPDPELPSIPLSAQHEISYSPSASVAILLNEEARKRPWPPRSLALVADPIYDFVDLRLRSAMENRSGSGIPRGIAAGPGKRHGGYERLPFAGTEAQRIAALFPSRLELLGLDARRDLVTGPQLFPYEAVHFATHGFAHRELPELSGIVLSQIGPDRRRQDGFLRSFEIYDLRLSASLVVLSGCETGLGEVVDGEGIVGLVRALFYAGTPRVVASLWQVDDEATATLMVHFYEGIRKKGLTAPAALRAAQAAVRADERWRSPYYWAGFVLQGAWV